MGQLRKNELTFLFSIFILICSVLITVGCQKIEETEAEEIITATKDEEVVEEKAVENKEEDDEIIVYAGEPSMMIDQVYTTEPLMALTFNGIEEQAKMDSLLEKLAEYDLSATFFLDQEQIIDNRDMITSIIDHGHTIELIIMNQQDLSELSYEEIYIEAKAGYEVIEEVTGRGPLFSRTKPWSQSNDLQLITAQLEMEAVIGHSIRPRNRDLENNDDLAKYIERALSRGGIISLDITDYPQVIDAIDFIIEEAKIIDYAIIPLADLVNIGEVRKPFEEIEGHDLIKKNLDYESEEPNLLYAKETDEKVVALTFDDYGSDKTVLQILDMLEENDIRSTFFLKAQNVERNPNLAKVILEHGHEIANHTYAHHRSTEISPEELQDDLIKAHRIITEAIQEQPTMLFRPPFGNIDEESAKVISAVGFNNIAMYDISSYDWNLEYTVDDVVNRVMDNVGPGSVIVMHILDDIHNIDALPIIIERLQGEGYSFVKMSEWFEE